MGRQWLLSKRVVVSQRKAQATTKFVREIMVAAKLGGTDPDLNARLAAAIEKAKKESVARDVIERAIKKGSGQGDDKMTMENVVFEGYAPHKVPLIVEAMTDNLNRTVPEIRVLFRNGQLGTTGSNKFLFEHIGLVEAYHPQTVSDLEIGEGFIPVIRVIDIHHANFCKRRNRIGNRPGISATVDEISRAGDIDPVSTRAAAVCRVLEFYVRCCSACGPGDVI